MTAAQIDKAQIEDMRRSEIKFGVAKTIRSALDEARKQYGASDWDDEDLQEEVLMIVTEEP